MWKDLPENEKEEYKRMILAFASLTELFSQKNEENDEIPAPIINSKYQETIFQKAFHASAEDIGNTSYDVATLENLCVNPLFRTGDNLTGNFKEEYNTY